MNFTEVDKAMVDQLKQIRELKSSLEKAVGSNNKEQIEYLREDIRSERIRYNGMANIYSIIKGVEVKDVKSHISDIVADEGIE